MNMTSAALYPRNVTGVVTVELLRFELCKHPRGTLIETSVRRLAAAIGRSAGQLSYHLHALAAQGWIDVLPGTSGTLIEVLRSDAERIGDHEPPGDENGYSAPEQHDRFVAPARIDHVAGAQRHDRHDVYGTSHESHEQHQHDARMRETLDLPAVPAGLEAFPVVPSAWTAMCAGTPGYSVEWFHADLEKLRTRGKEADQATGLIVYARSRGEAIYSAEELRARAQQYGQLAVPPAAPAASSADPSPPARPRRPPRSGRTTPDDAILPSPDPSTVADAKATTARARALAPPGTDEDEVQLLALDLDDGYSDVAALARLAARLAEAGDG